MNININETVTKTCGIKKTKFYCDLAPSGIYVRTVRILCIFNPSLISILSMNFWVFSLFLHISEICCLLILNLSAKFVPFSPLPKCEIMVCLSFIERTDYFCCVDMAMI